MKYINLTSVSLVILMIGLFISCKNKNNQKTSTVQTAVDDKEKKKNLFDISNWRTDTLVYDTLGNYIIISEKIAPAQLELPKNFFNNQDSHVLQVDTYSADNGLGYTHQYYEVKIPSQGAVHPIAYDGMVWPEAHDVWAYDVCDSYTVYSISYARYYGLFQTNNGHFDTIRMDWRTRMAEDISPSGKHWAVALCPFNSEVPYLVTDQVEVADSLFNYDIIKELKWVDEQTLISHWWEGIEDYEGYYRLIFIPQEINRNVD